MSARTLSYESMSKADKEKALDLWKLGCRADFKLWFQTAAKLIPKTPGAKAITPRMNIMQQRITEAIEWCDANGFPARLINLKPRQGGSSSIFLGTAYHRARTSRASVAILGDDKNTTEKLDRMWRHYGETDVMGQFWGNAPKNPHQPTWQDFSHGSSLTWETANDPRAGQGGTFTVLIASEVASYRSSGHSTGEDVFSSIANCVPRLAKTLIAMESTAQGQFGIFYTTFQGAVTFEEFKAGKRGNGYIKFFTPWFAFDDYTFDGRDGRQGLTEWEREQIPQTLDDEETALIRRFGGEVITPERLAWRRQTIASEACGGDVRKFKREYPATAEEAFQGSGRAYFDVDGLMWQEQQITPATMAPQTGNIVLKDGRAPTFLKGHVSQSLFRIWEYPADGESYILPCDWCVGRQAEGASGELDTNAFAVIRAGRLDPVTRRMTLPRVVAAVMPDDRSKGAESIQRVLALHRLYGDCHVVPEINNKDNICEQLQAAGVTNILSQRTGADGAKPGVGRTSQVLGFLTTGTAQGGGTRKQILDNLETMVRECSFIVSCPEILRQLKVFIRNLNGRGEAPPGDHDDWVMMLAIGMFFLGSATPFKSWAGQSALAMGGFRRAAMKLHPMGL